MRRVADTKKETHMTTRDTREKTEGADGRMTTRAFWFLGNHLTVLADHADTGGRYDLIEGRPLPVTRHHCTAIPSMPNSSMC